MEKERLEIKERLRNAWESENGRDMADLGCKPAIASTDLKCCLSRDHDKI